MSQSIVSFVNSRIDSDHDKVIFLNRKCFVSFYESFVELFPQLFFYVMKEGWEEPSDLTALGQSEGGRHVACHQIILFQQMRNKAFFLYSAGVSPCVCHLGWRTFSD